MATVPLRVSNRLGFPMLEVQRVEPPATGSTVTKFVFNNHPQRGYNFFGGFFVKVPQNLTTLTDTNTVAFATDGVSDAPVPLVLYDGSTATVADIVTSGGGIMLCFYDRASNSLRLVNAF